ncbi:nucleoside hydrolase [Actinocrispum wychmicini]|uniref:Pyrimidine-specific ribonucleoside hydrolase n=1 Tax=Actinocrispum wychmicini TaxID=1213861 RepID=A0A4R2K3G2_9PSEU|nr:nucleoside hydrolase [Actinocrispum wychmicini]TCO64308.1 pyrimidine-specific ribonucleoside hydrolase [Actinocrispum wychmicini]
MRRLIIDTDPGVDDAFAIALACASPDVDLMAVTTVAGNIGIEHTTRNALNLLALCGREDVPVAAGAHRPFSRPVRGDTAHGVDGLGGHAHALPTSKATGDPRDAITLLKDTLEASEGPVTVIAIGPMTNVALLLAAHPGVKPKIDRLVIMGGGIAGGNITPSAEFNVWVDPEAARRVLVEEDVPVTLVPLDVTMRCAVGDEWLGQLADHPVGRELVAMTPHYRAFYKETFGRDDFVMHDAIAVAEAINPGLLRTTPLRLEVDCTDGPGSGATIADRRTPPQPDERFVDVALDADIDALRAYILGELAR